MTASELLTDNSSAALSPSKETRRPLRVPGRKRPKAFTAAFDARTLFYDCFWHADGQRIILVGPPLEAIAARAPKARFVADPGGVILQARYFSSLSVTVTELRGAPEFATSIRAFIAGQEFTLRIWPNSSSLLKDRRVLFSINKDNDLAWIREWAEFHARLHGTDAVILFDNASTRYSRDELLETLRAVPGIAHAGVPSWPYPFGPIDPAVKRDPYWARFLQIGSMSVVLRRFGAEAYGLLDCDVDELAGTRSGKSIYDLARHSRGGLVAFRGTWIEATGEGRRHRDFRERLSDAAKARSPQRKWVLDPSRPWVKKLSVHPYWHWVEGRSLFAKSMPHDALYWHFKAINTNWKQARTAPPAGSTEAAPLLAAAFEKLSS